MHYLLVARDTSFYLVGPFDSNDSAAVWGRDPANNPSDDPRWQTIELADAGVPVEVIPPDRPMAVN
jgi:hypothetical protein